MREWLGHIRNSTLARRDRDLEIALATPRMARHGMILPVSTIGCINYIKVLFTWSIVIHKNIPKHRLMRGSKCSQDWVMDEPRGHMH